MKNNCFNCAHCEIDKSQIGPNSKPFICLYNQVPPMKVSEVYNCSCHYFESENDFKDSMFEDAKHSYLDLKDKINILENKYPQLKQQNQTLSVTCTIKDGLTDEQFKAVESFVNCFPDNTLLTITITKN